MAPLSEDLEFDLALSALPDQLRAEATVYRLELNQGYVVARQGSNGFHAFVARTDPQGIHADRADYAYPHDMLVPIAFDATGARHHLLPWFDLAEMRARGLAPSQAREEILARYADGTYSAPSTGGVSYMLSPVLRAYANSDVSDDVVTFNAPHYMFYGPDTENRAIGGFTPPTSHPFTLGGGPHGFIIMIASRAEIEAINRNSADLIERACAANPVWCLERTD